MGNEEKRQPSFPVSLGVCFGIVAILMIGLIILDADLHILLILSICLSIFVAKLIGYKWSDIQSAMANGVSRALSALFIVVMIGMVIGSWIQAGTVPALIYYGLETLSPAIFLPAGLIICSICSIATGSSWSTVGTVGLAMIGIGESLGIPLPITVGMIVSGAYIGDQISPLSDTIVLSAASAESDIFTQIRMILPSAVVSFLIALVIYTFVGMSYGSGTIDTKGIESITNGLSNSFNLSIWVLLPVVVTLGLSIAKVSALPAMGAGVLSAGIVSMVFQGASLTNVLFTLNYGYSGQSGIDMVDNLLNTGGIQGMMWTFSLAFIALALGGILEEMGFLKVLVKRIIKGVKRGASLVAVTIASIFVSNLATGELYTSIVINGRLYKASFQEKKLAKGMLARCLQQGGTLLTVLIPWTTSGIFIAGILGVSPLAFAPFAFANWITPILTIILVYMGIGLYSSDDEARMENKKGFLPNRKIDKVV